MNLCKEAFNLLFSDVPHCLTKIVASRLSGKPLPTTADKLDKTKTTIGNAINKKTDWPIIKAAAEKHRPRLVKLAGELANVSPACVAKVHKLQLTSTPVAPVCWSCSHPVSTEAEGLGKTRIRPCESKG